MADEKYFYHCGFSSFIAVICRVLRRFARIVFCGKIVKNITVSAKRGRMRRIEAVKRSKNVVKDGVFYYSGYSSFESYRTEYDSKSQLQYIHFNLPIRQKNELKLLCPP